jgi:hypothetical protein
LSHIFCDLQLLNQPSDQPHDTRRYYYANDTH